MHPQDVWAQFHQVSGQQTGFTALDNFMVNLQYETVIFKIHILLQ